MTRRNNKKKKKQLQNKEKDHTVSFSLTNPLTGFPGPPSSR